MRTKKSISINKRAYIKPTLACIKLDNEISLALQSTPPAGPGESVYNSGNTPESLIQSPFQDSKA